MLTIVLSLRMTTNRQFKTTLTFSVLQYNTLPSCPDYDISRHHLPINSTYMCACVCACARARVCLCVCVCVNCGVKILMFVNPQLNHMHALLITRCGVKWYFFICFRFIAYTSCFPVGETYLSPTKSGLSGSHRLNNSPDTWIGLRMY